MFADVVWDDETARLVSNGSHVVVAGVFATLALLLFGYRYARRLRGRTLLDLVHFWR